MNILITPNGDIKTYTDPKNRKDMEQSFVDGSVLESQLRALGYEIEKFLDKSSGVMTIRAVPPLKKSKLIVND
jgi:hypothetical protein